VAWNMATSGLYENFTGDRPDVCLGQTIFGLTSTTGQTDIYDINFVANVDQYVSTASDIQSLRISSDQNTLYDLQGRRVDSPKTTGVYIQNKRKVVY